MYRQPELPKIATFKEIFTVDTHRTLLNIIEEECRVADGDVRNSIDIQFSLLRIQ